MIRPATNPEMIEPYKPIYSIPKVTRMMKKEPMATNTALV